MRSIPVPCTWLAVMVIALATVGCDDGAGSGGADMDALAARLDESNKAAAAAEQTQDATKKAAPAQAAAEAQPPAQQPDNETSITITVKNPQGLLSSPEAKDAVAGIVGKKHRRKPSTRAAPLLRCNSQRPHHCHGPNHRLAD